MQQRKQIHSFSNVTPILKHNSAEKKFKTFSHIPISSIFEFTISFSQ